METVGIGHKPQDGHAMLRFLDLRIWPSDWTSGLFCCTLVDTRKNLPSHWGVFLGEFMEQTYGLFKRKALPKHHGPLPFVFLTWSRDAAKPPDWHVQHLLFGMLRFTSFDPRFLDNFLR